VPPLKFISLYHFLASSTFIPIASEFPGAKSQFTTWLLIVTHSEYLNFNHISNIFKLEILPLPLVEVTGE